MRHVKRRGVKKKCKKKDIKLNIVDVFQINLL